MRKSVLLANLLFSLIIFTCGILQAEISDFSIHAGVRKDVQSLGISLSLSGTSLIGCTYSLYSSASSSQLSQSPINGKLIASGSIENGITQLQANALDWVKVKSKAYFKAELDCSTESATSAIADVRLAALDTGTISPKAWVAQLRKKIKSKNLRLVNAYPDLTFTQPLDFQHSGSRIFVAEQDGKIQEIISAGSAIRTFIDISSKITTSTERGLIGFVLHPNFADNGYFYVRYSQVGTGNTIISRFQATAPDFLQASADTEVALLNLEQPSPIHKGGAMAFGSDGYLYLGVGDGGGAGDPNGNGQKRTTLLGKLLRIDVDSTANGENYAIPADNPFVGNNSGYKEEIFAYGFRNPWKFSFDSTTGDIWLADVGQDKFEEVNLVQKGKNYGWKIMEGKSCYSPRSGCNTAGLVKPIVDYPREMGHSITGGYVYRGTAVPALSGLYVFGDFTLGRIYTLKKGTKRIRDLFTSGLYVSSFGVDQDNELYVVSFGDGKIYKFSES